MGTTVREMAVSREKGVKGGKKVAPKDGGEEAATLVGGKAPHFSLPDKEDVLFSLKQFQGSYVVLFFYPKDNTPGCTIEAKEFSAEAAQFKKLGVTVIGISGGTSATKAKFCAAQKISVPLLSDSDFAVSRAYGVFGKKSFMGRSYDGIFRTTFVISPDGEVIKQYAKVKPESHAKEVLADLSELCQQSTQGKVAGSASVRGKSKRAANH